MELFEAIERRYSHRKAYRQDPVPREHLEQIVQAGLLAPSGKNAQTTEFIIVDDQALLDGIRAMNPANPALRDARAMILCLISRDAAAVYEGFSFEAEDCAAAVENMLLAITALGYASVWIDGWLRVQGRADAIGEIIGIPPEKVVRVLLPVGIPAEPGQQPPKKPFNQRAWFNGYKP